MCVAAAAIPAASLAISAASAVSSIGMGIYSAQQQAAQAQAGLQMQAQQAQMQQQQFYESSMQQQQQQRQQQILGQKAQAQNYNLQVAQNNAALYNQNRQAQEQVLNERASIQSRHAASKLAYQRSDQTFRDQVNLNNEAANRTYMGEQSKLSEAKKKAAFEQQAIIAKSIGAKGKVLAAGRTGQSVGLLVNDVERQAGFKLAQESAMYDSKKEQVTIGMETAFLQAQSDNNKAASNVAWNPSDPYMPKMPDSPAYVDGNDFSIQY